jgi:tetratricopeptide (TPR) repeat protein
VHVLIALADVGVGVQLEEALSRAGFAARWDGTQADGPRGASTQDVVVIDADHLGKDLCSVTDAWRDHISVPGVVALGASATAREQAPLAKVTLLAPSAQIATLANAIREAAKLRLSTGMRWPVLRAALELPPAANTPEAWPATLLHARNADIEIARSALRWHAQHYATTTAIYDQLREERMLTVPELETTAHVDGTKTVQTLVKAGPLDPSATARLLWALTSMGAVVLTPEVHDLATAPRRALDEIRNHLRARTRRLAKSSYFDVLEISPLAEYPEIEAGYRLVGARYSPKALSRFDLAELAPLAKPIWEQVEKARMTLVDHAARGRYMDWLRQHLDELDTVWAIDERSLEDAAESFARGQQLLAGGDVHRAMGELARACRNHPGHPDYEANLAWARFRIQVAAGKDQRETALAERQTVEEHLAGRRPWPRALVALALLCAASGDADAARWHLHISLQFDPNAPAAQQLAHRLGVRR